MLKFIFLFFLCLSSVSQAAEVWPFPWSAPHYKRLPDIPRGQDPEINKQWYLQDIGFLKVLQYTGNRRVIVAVIDTGVDYMHPDLNHSIWMNPGEAGVKANNGIDDDKNGYVDDFMGWNFIENNNLPYDRIGSSLPNIGHGTHCAGIVAAERGNAFEIAGIASGVELMPVRVIGSDLNSDVTKLVQGVKYAVDNGAAVISVSWESSGNTNPNSIALLREAFAYASQHNRLLVVGAGNGHLNLDTNPGYSLPAGFNLPTQITVAAIDATDMLTKFSNYGRTIVHIAAPGVGIWSTVPTGGTRMMDGTSASAPIVAAAAALFWSQRPDLSAQQVKEAILESAQLTPSLQGKVLTGGRLNIETLMNKVGHPPLRY